MHMLRTLGTVLKGEGERDREVWLQLAAELGSSQEEIAAASQGTPAPVRGAGL